MTLTLLCPQTTTHDSDASTEPPFTAHLRSAAALRAAVNKVHAEGWDSTIGQALLDALAITPAVGGPGRGQRPPHPRELTR